MFSRRVSQVGLTNSFSPLHAQYTANPTPFQPTKTIQSSLVHHMRPARLGPNCSVKNSPRIGVSTLFLFVSSMSMVQDKIMGLLFENSSTKLNRAKLLWFSEMENKPGTSCSSTM